MSASAKPSDSTLRVGIVGTGRQGLALIDAMLNPADPIPGVRIDALCDIWPAALETGVRRLRAVGQTVRSYDRFDLLLEREAGLDAVIVATPDFAHTPVTLAALTRGLHVYCESRMAGGLGDATAMLRAARRSDRLLQVGYHRRSDPVYRAAVEKLLMAENIIGPIRSARAEHFEVAREQWRPLAPEHVVPADILRSHGYASMDELRLWRRHRKFGGGPLPHPGEHQLDTLNWMIGGQVTRIVATGDRDPAAPGDWCDNLAVLLAYEVSGRIVRAGYQADTRSVSDGVGPRERIAGERGTFWISPRSNVVRALPEPRQYLEHWIDPPFQFLRYFNDCLPGDPKAIHIPGTAWVNVDPSCVVKESYDMIVPEGSKLPYQPHVENFFAAIRGEANLNCPAETAYRTECMLAGIDAALTGTGEGFTAPRLTT